MLSLTRFKFLSKRTDAFFLLCFRECVKSFHILFCNLSAALLTFQIFIGNVVAT